MQNFDPIGLIEKKIWPKATFAIEKTNRQNLDYCSFLAPFLRNWKAHNFFSFERNGLKFCMHDRNMLWKAHDFLAYARQPRTAQTSVHHRDAGTGPCQVDYSLFLNPFALFFLNNIYLFFICFIVPITSTQISTL